MKELPKGWTTTTLGEILLDPKKDLVDGPFGSNLKSSEYGSIGIPVFKIQNIKANCFIDKKIDFITEEKAATISRHSFQCGDLIITKLGNPLGLCCKVPDKYNYGIIVADLMRLRPSSICINTDFLVYLVNSRVVQHQFQKITKGTTRSRVNLTIVRDITIPLSPLPEQHRIVAKIEELFSSLDKGIENLKTAQAQLKTYRQAVLKWAFEGKLTNKNVKEGKLPEGWKWVKIGDMCKCIVPNRDKPKSFSGEIKWVTTPNLSEKSIRIDYRNIPVGLSNDEVKRYNARTIPIGSVIMTCVGNFGISAIVERQIVINQQLHAFLSNESINMKFLAYCIQFNKNYFEKKSTSTTIQYLNKGNCNSMPFPLCPLTDQDHIVSEIESRLSVCDKLEESITQSLSQAEALRQSILKKAFEGKLVPQDPNDEPAGILLERIQTERQNTQPAKNTRNTKKKENGKRN